MKVFVTGTDTNIGKTIVCSWLALHTDHAYFKPIQCGTHPSTDSQTVKKMAGQGVFKETFCFNKPLSPHLASVLENVEIDINTIKLPNTNNLIVEGAGGLLVPINKTTLVIDLISFLSLPVILVTRPSLGTINHTLLSIEALRLRKIPLLGVIMNNGIDQNNIEAIEFYGRVKVLACLPKLGHISKEVLREVPLTKELKKIFGIKS